MGAKEIRADPVVLARLAQSYLDNSKAVANALNAARAKANIAPTAFGNLPAVMKVYPEYTELLGSAGTVAERFTGVLEVDNDSLLQAAFNYHDADIKSGQAIAKSKKVP